MDHIFPREQLGSDGRDEAVLDRHVVLTGDFNTTPDSEVCQVIAEVTGRCAHER